MMTSASMYREYFTQFSELYSGYPCAAGQTIKHVRFSPKVEKHTSRLRLVKRGTVRQFPSERTLYVGKRLDDNIVRAETKALAKARAMSIYGG